MSAQQFLGHCPVGVNLGGWLSQYAHYDHQHFAHFIGAADVRQIADWGMDHIRLPVDYPILEDDAAPGVYRESGFDYLEACFTWCEANHLSVVLDLHHAPGYSFTQTLEGENGNTLFDSRDAQERFFALWEAIARRFLGRYPRLAFELLNEVVLPASGPWNDLAARAVARVRTIDASRPIVIGSNLYGAISTLEELDLIHDENIVYTFHCYEPMLFTHQCAPWVPAMRTLGAVVDYPGSVAGLAEFSAEHREYAGFCDGLVGQHMDRALIESILAPTLAFRDRAQRPLYCGEFGVIDVAPAASRRAWLADFIAFLNAHGIGRAIWSYKQMDFGLVDANSRVIDPEYVRIAASR